MSEMIDTLELLEVQIRVSPHDEEVIRADERNKIKEETRKLVRKLYALYNVTSSDIKWLEDQINKLGPSY